MKSQTELQASIDQLSKADLLARLDQVGNQWPVYPSWVERIRFQARARELAGLLSESEPPAWEGQARAFLHQLAITHSEEMSQAGW